jgi:hypothetical protein
MHRSPSTCSTLTHVLTLFALYPTFRELPLRARLNAVKKNNRLLALCINGRPASPIPTRQIHITYLVVFLLDRGRAG